MTRTLDPAPALELVRAVLLTRPHAVVLIDGRSGSGKSTFADALAADAASLRLEDVYPGWDGLEAASSALARLLGARGAGASVPLRGWDWTADAPGGRLAVPPAGPLVVEGCGALSRRAARSADLRVWVELPEPERRARALARDGAVYAPHWDRWARQERAFIAREDPRGAADLVVDGRRFPQPLFSERTGNAHYPRRP